MYSATIKPKVDKMFSDLGKQAREIISISTSMNDAANHATRLVSSEVSTRSKTILSDMLYDLTRHFMKNLFIMTPLQVFGTITRVFPKKHILQFF